MRGKEKKSKREKRNDIASGSYTDSGYDPAAGRRLCGNGT